MAERRMFSNKITDSDAFLDMPLSAQALYFHLNMQADDDGFLNNPKKVQRMTGASEQDLQTLIDKRFVLSFDSGVIVIKHWRMNNQIRKDRYSPTQYKEELSKLAIKDNGAYTDHPQPNGNQLATDWQPNGNQTAQGEIQTDGELSNTEETLKNSHSDDVATKWQPNGNQLATQNRLGKDSIGKYRLEEDRIDKVSIGQSRIGEDTESSQSNDDNGLQNRFEIVQDRYNTICVSLPKARMLTSSRKEAIETILNEHGLMEVIKVFQKAEATPFLKGFNESGWKASLDWLINPDNFLKVLEGQYDN